MMRLTVLIAFALALSSQSLLGGDGDKGSITVEVKGTLANGSFVRGPEDDSWRLATADVHAVGQKLPLDCSRCVAARRELIRRYADNPSSVIWPEVVVKGRLEFRAPAEGKAAIPVVVVESLEIGSPSFTK